MIKIFIESGVNAAQKKGSKRTTNEQNFVETLVAHYFPHAVLGTDYLVVGVNGKDQLPNTQPVCKHSIFRLDAHYSQTYLCAITK